MFTGILQSPRAQRRPGPHVLVTVHPSHWGSDGRLLPPDLDGRLIGLQDRFKAHYALCIESYFREYFRARIQACPSLMRVIGRASSMESDEHKSPAPQTTKTSREYPADLRMALNIL